MFKELCPREKCWASPGIIFVWTVKALLFQMTTLHSKPKNRATCLHSGLWSFAATAFFFQWCFLGFFENLKDLVIWLCFWFSIQCFVKISYCRQFYVDTQNSYTDVGVTNSTRAWPLYFRIVIKMSVFSTIDRAVIFFYVRECWNLLFPSVLEHCVKSEAVLGRLLGYCFPVLFSDSSRYFLHSSE